MGAKGGCSPRIRSPLLREFLAEFLGTFILVLFGTGSIAQSVLSLNNKGDFFAINWGWFIGILLGVLVSGGVSGGHLNPAVSVAVATLGKFPWWKVPHYLAAQYLGAFTASTVVFLVYWDALVWYEHDRGAYRTTPDTAGIFATYPGRHLSWAGGVGDQFLGTAMLLICLCAITDRKNMNVSKQLVPLYVGFTVLGIGICFGFNCGYAVNPARDLAPRLFTALAGWGPEVFSYYSHWWIVPVVASHLGAIAGAWIYYLCVEMNWPRDLEPESEKENPEPMNGKGSYIQYPNGRPQDNDQETQKLNQNTEEYKPLPTKAAFHDELKKTVAK
ncbi:aquaporin-7 [Eurytemora carolleeae]|uniref:aquaporin-7 n=1 Tax=Eurytemora carolleeae TaxID=1294199 RepID=UPI000C77DC1C|nr:aquaporin-7 [Eurytemora carolleeae]|eukprot:XP_023336662.1 aquaporin-7-like [Eurytemora affinis]